MLLREREVRNDLVAGQETIATQARVLARNSETITDLEAKLEVLRTSTDEAVESLVPSETSEAGNHTSGQLPVHLRAFGHGYGAG